MNRLFVGIRPPRPVREALLASMGGIAGARWQNDNQLHLTLRFIGEVDRHAAADVVAALGRAGGLPFSITTGDIGYFDKDGRINTLWVGVRPARPVELLHKSVDRALAMVGIAPDDRAFTPHITLARFARSVAPLVPPTMGQVMIPAVEWAVDGFCLFESVLTPEGSVYHVVERYSLR